jgi:hypothetical protein
MAKGDVTMVFDADTAKSVQAILQMRDKLISLASTTRDFGDSGPGALNAIADAAAKAGQGISNTLGTVAGVAISVAGAVEALNGTVDNFLDQMDQRADKLLKKTLDLNSSLASAGQGESAPEVRKQLDALAANGVGGVPVDPDVANRMFAAVSNQLGDKISAQQKIEATKTGLFGIGAKLDENAATQLAIDYGKLDAFRKPGMGMEKIGDDQLQEYASQLQAAYPEGIPDQVLRFLSRAKNKDAAMKAAIAAPQVYEGGRAINSVLTTAEESIDRDKVLEAEIKLVEAHKGNANIEGLPESVIQKARADVAAEIKKNPSERREILKASRGEDHFSQEEATLLRLNAIAPDDRLDAVLNDPSLLPPADQAVARNLRSGESQIPKIPSLKSQVEWWRQNSDPVTFEAEQNRLQSIVSNQIDQANAPRALYEKDIISDIQNTFKKEHPTLDNVGLGKALGFGAGATYFLLDRVLPTVNRELGIGQNPPPANEDSAAAQQQRAELEAGLAQGWSSRHAIARRPDPEALPDVEFEDELGAAWAKKHPHAVQAPATRPSAGPDHSASFAQMISGIQSLGQILQQQTATLANKLAQTNSLLQQRQNTALANNNAGQQ